MIELRAERSAYMRRTSLWVVVPGPGDSLSVARPLTFDAEVELGVASAPALQLADDEVQQFMDELWRAGFRPSEGTGSAGALAATERHLEDMRRLVFSAPIRRPEPQVRIRVEEEDLDHG